MTITWRLYSCDDHLDLWNLPRDLWEGRLPARLREGGPHVVEQGGNAWWACDGSVLGPCGMEMMCGPRTNAHPDSNFEDWRGAIAHALRGRERALVVRGTATDGGGPCGIVRAGA